MHTFNNLFCAACMFKNIRERNLNLCVQSNDAIQRQKEITNFRLAMLWAILGYLVVMGPYNRSGGF